MNQISATFIKGIKDNITNKIALFWVIAWPLLWLFLGIYVFLRQVPPQYMEQAKTQTTISMVGFAIVIAGMSSLTANIGEDRQRGMFLKLKTMPIQPWKDSVGRILAILVFCFIAIAIIIAIGIILGARFEITFGNIIKSLGLFILSILAASGIGLILGSIIRNLQGAIMTGVGIAVVTSVLSGISFDYSILPGVLQQFSRLWPISAINNTIIYILTGSFTYNPLTVFNIIYIILVSILFFAAGIIVYTRYCWRFE